MASVSVTFNNNFDEVLEAFGEQVGQGLIAIGLTAETNAKQEITKAVYDTPESPNYKRTGRLRNSITFAISGQAPNILSYKDDNDNVFSYSGRAPMEGDEPAVYIGSNVEYAPDVELGTSKMKPRPFIKPAAENYKDQYKQLMREALSED